MGKGIHVVTLDLEYWSKIDIRCTTDNAEISALLLGVHVKCMYHMIDIYGDKSSIASVGMLVVDCRLSRLYRKAALCGVLPRAPSDLGATAGPLGKFRNFIQFDPVCECTPPLSYSILFCFRPLRSFQAELRSGSLFRIQ